MSTFNVLSGQGLGYAGEPKRGKVIFTSTGITGDSASGAGGTYNSGTNSYAYTWTAPFGVSKASIVAIGGGGGGANSNSGTNGGGGGGGGLAYINNLTVTPGTTYNLQVGGGGAPGDNGADSWFNSSSYFKAIGGYVGTAGTDSSAQGQVLFTASGTIDNTTNSYSYTWTCPEGVYAIHAVTIGAGGGGGASGGGGGGLAYGNDIPVTPGQNYKIQVGAPGKIIYKTYPGYLDGSYGGVYGQNNCKLDSVEGLYIGQHMAYGYLPWYTVISNIDVPNKIIYFSNTLLGNISTGDRLYFSVNGGNSFIQNISSGEVYLLANGGGTAYPTANYDYVGTYRQSQYGNFVNVYGLQTGYEGGGGGAGGYNRNGGNGQGTTRYLFGAGGGGAGTYLSGSGTGGNGGGWQQYIQTTSNPYSSGYLGPYYNYGYAGNAGGGYGAGGAGSNGYWGGDGGGVTTLGSTSTQNLAGGAAPPTAYASYGGWANTYPGSPGIGSGSYGGGGGGGGGVGKNGQPGAVRIMWGRGRSYPSNAADVVATSFVPGTTYGGGGGGGAGGYSGNGGSGGSDIAYGAPVAGGNGSSGSGSVSLVTFSGGKGGSSVGQITEYGPAGPSSGGSGSGGSGGYNSPYGGGGTGLLGRSNYNSAGQLSGGGGSTVTGGTASAVNNGASGGTDGTSSSGGLYGGGGPYNGSGGSGGVAILWGPGNSFPSPTNLP